MVPGFAVRSSIYFSKMISVIARQQEPMMSSAGTFSIKGIQLNLSTTLTTATLRSNEIDRCGEVAVVERFKQESVYGTSARNSGLL